MMLLSTCSPEAESGTPAPIDTGPPLDYPVYYAPGYEPEALVRRVSVPENGLLFVHGERVTGTVMLEWEKGTGLRLNGARASWAAKDRQDSKWPETMSTQFAELSPAQRESVRALGINAFDWDRQVENFLGEMALRQKDMRSR